MHYVELIAKLSGCHDTTLFPKQLSRTISQRLILLHVHNLIAMRGCSPTAGTRRSVWQHGNVKTRPPVWRPACAFCEPKSTAAVEVLISVKRVPAPPWHTKKVIYSPAQPHGCISRIGQDESQSNSVAIAVRTQAKVVKTAAKISSDYSVRVRPQQEVDTGQLEVWRPFFLHQSRQHSKVCCSRFHVCLRRSGWLWRRRSL